MAQTESASRKVNSTSRGSYLKVAFLVVLGISITALSAAFGKQLSWGELVYEVGLAVIIAAIIDLLIVRAIAEWKSKTQRLLDESDRVINELKAFQEEMKKQTLELATQSTNLTVNSIENLCQNIAKEIDKIRRSTDSSYAVLAEAAEAQENTR